MNRPTLLLTAILTGLPALAHADTSFDLHIPASACRPILDDVDTVKLSDGAWVFESNESGSATLFCPLHLAAPDDSDLSYSPFMAQMRLWYIDPSGTGTTSSVSATLKRREFDDSTDSTVGSSIASNSFSDTIFSIANTLLNHTANFDDFSYHVEVTMVRSSTTVATPVFVGLDFEPSPTV